jgi:hypothetical protein
MLTSTIKNVCQITTMDRVTIENGFLQQLYFNMLRVNKFGIFLYHIHICVVKTSIIDSPKILCGNGLRHSKCTLRNYTDERIVTRH